MHFLIEDRFEDREWLGGLIKITAQELPITKQKRKVQVNEIRLHHRLCCVRPKSSCFSNSYLRGIHN